MKELLDSFTVDELEWFIQQQPEDSIGRLAAIALAVKRGEMKDISLCPDPECHTDFMPVFKEKVARGKRIEELERVCAESYQVVSALAYTAGVFETSEAVSAALDNLSQAKIVHEDVLPFDVGSGDESLPMKNFRSAMEGIGHIRRTLEETFGGLHGTHVEPDVIAECKEICDAICAAYRKAAEPVTIRFRPEDGKLLADTAELLKKYSEMGNYMPVMIWDEKP